MPLAGIVHPLCKHERAAYAATRAKATKGTTSPIPFASRVRKEQSKIRFEPSESPRPARPLGVFCTIPSPIHMSHSPAPWKTDLNDNDEVILFDATGRPIAFLFTTPPEEFDGMTEEEEEARQFEEGDTDAVIRTAPKLLKMCKNYASDCQTRIDILQEEAISVDCCEEAVAASAHTDAKDIEHGKHCDIGQQIEHWKATKRLVDVVIEEAENKQA